MERIRAGIPLLVSLALLGALVFVVTPYLDIFSSNRHSRSRAVDEVSDDSGDHAFTRGLMGGATGIALGLFVLFRTKEEDDA